MHALKFRVVPMAGKTIDYRGQEYKLIGSAPHRNRKGELSVILTWKTHCLECGVAFTTTSALCTKYLTRRCPKHRKAGKGVVMKKTSSRGGRYG
jgi:hypothetical protein